MQWAEHGAMALQLLRVLQGSSLTELLRPCFSKDTRKWSYLLSKRCISQSFNLQQRSCTYRPRRAVMYVPASDERKYRKIPSLGADTVVLDCEDGVANNKKVGGVSFKPRPNCSSIIGICACTSVCSKL